MSENHESVSRSLPNVPEKVVTLDDVLVNEVGQFGWYQARITFLVAIPIILGAIKSDYIFTLAAIPHRCRIPECGELGKLHEYDPEWILNAVPERSSGFSSCERYVPSSLGTNGSLDYCPATLFDQTKTIGCDGYVYARNDTAVYDFDLGCQDWLRVLAGTLTNLGYFCGLPVTGYLSDRFGRRFALIYSLFIFGIIGLPRIFSINYTMFLILETVKTFFGGGVFSSSFILAAELVGPKYRVFIASLTSSMFSVGQIILGTVAWQIQSWRQLIIVLYIPCLFIISYFWIMNESVRWLLAKRRYTEAREILETLAKVNGKKINEKSLEALTNPPVHQSHLDENVEVKNSNLIGRILRSPILLRRVCTTPIWWITATLVYYGLSINSTSLSNTMYLNYVLVSAIEIPGFFSAILVLDRFGRKTSLSTSYFLCAACNIIFAFLPNSYASLRLIIYLVGKFCISLVLGSLYLYTSELYPTEFRHTLLAFSSMIGRIGSIVAPLTPVLMNYWHGIPSILFGCLGILSGLLMLTQPETLGAKMPDTIAEAEALGKSNAKMTCDSDITE